MIFSSLQHETDPNRQNFARAVIKENNDPEKKGRVKVEYPWVQDSSETISEWARVLMPFASAESGMWFVPEVGDEVIVLFEGGDFDHPVVVGSLYSPKKKPPASSRKGDFNENEKNDLRYIKTRSGHMLCFDDSDSDAGIYIEDKKGNKIEIQSEKKTILISDQKKNQIKLDDSGIEVKNSNGQKVVLDSSGVTVEGSQIKLGKAAMHALVKGDLFQAFFNTHTHMTAWGPSSPPLVPMNPSLLSQTSKTS